MQNDRPNGVGFLASQLPGFRQELITNARHLAFLLFREDPDVLVTAKVILGFHFLFDDGNGFTGADGGAFPAEFAFGLFHKGAVVN